MPTKSKLLTTIDDNSDLIPIPHVGETILEDFLKPLGKSAYWLAKGLDVPYTRVNNIISGRIGVTADTAIRLSRFLGCSVEFWTGLQADYEVRVSQRKKAQQYDRIQPREGLDKAA